VVLTAPTAMDPLDARKCYVHLNLQTEPTSHMLHIYTLTRPNVMLTGTPLKWSSHNLIKFGTVAAPTKQRV